MLWDANSTPNFKADISKANVFAKLNHDISVNPNENNDILGKIIVHNIYKHFPRRQVKFNKYKHNKNTWITKGILHYIGLYRDVWIAAIASSRTSLATLRGSAKFNKIPKSIKKIG